MRFRRAAPVTLIVAVGIVVIASAGASNKLFGGLTESVERSQYDSMQAIIAFNLRGAESRALARAEMIADLPRVQALVAAHDRPGLIAELGAAFASQHEKYGVDQMQFHVPPARSLVRMQAPDKFDDDLTASRPMVVAVNHDRAARTGAEIAKTGPAIFAVVPVSDAAGAHVGSVEIGMNVGGVLDALKTAYGLEGVFFVEEAPMKTVATGARPEVFDAANQVGRYLKYDATNWALMKELVRGPDLTAVEQPVRYARSVGGRTYGVVLIPVKSGTGTPLGVIAIAKDFSASRAAAGRSVVWQGLIAVLGVLVMAGIVMIVLRGFLLLPLASLNARFAALARGEPGAPIEDADSFPTELRELAAHHDALRERLAPEAPEEDPT